MDYTIHGILQARILEWVNFSFSRGSSQTSHQTQFFLIAGWFFTSWATREAQHIGVGSLSLLQRIFLIQELNQGLLHHRQILYQLSHKGSPRLLEWVVYPFSRGSSWLRNRTRISCIAGGFFTCWATRSMHLQLKVFTTHCLTLLALFPFLPTEPPALIQSVIRPDWLPLSSQHSPWLTADAQQTQSR